MFANGIYTYISRWERRVDNRGRVYYVDHNSRTTTWQRPTTDIISNYNQWDSWRNQRNMALENLQNRFLFPNPATMVQDDPLGSLPEGWGKSKIYNKRRYGVNSKTMTQKKNILHSTYGLHNISTYK